MTNNILPQELSEIIGDIYEAALTAKWGGVLDKLIEITQSNKAFFFLQELGKEQPAILEMKTTFEFPHKALID